MNYTMSVEQIKEAIRDRLAHTFAVSLENATDEEYYKASALIVRELLAKGRTEFVQNAEKTGTKQIYYLCMEFLHGPFPAEQPVQPGPGGGLPQGAGGAWASSWRTCMSRSRTRAWATAAWAGLPPALWTAWPPRAIPAMGYSLRYEYGIFRQKLVDGWQTELPDFWLPGGEVWLQPRAGTSQ